MRNFSNSDLQCDYIKRIDKVLEYIEENINSTLSLEEMSNLANFSSFHFHRIFNTIVGETPVQYQRRRRIEASVNELYKNTTIKEISNKYGYSSPSSYSREVKKYFGESPSNYRKILKSKVTETSLNYQIGLEIIPELNLAFIEIKGFKNIIPSFISLIGQLKRRRIKVEKTLQYILDNPHITEEDKCRIKICAMVPNNTIRTNYYNVIKTEEKKYAVMKLKGSTKKIDNCINAVYKWIIINKLEPGDSALLIKFNKIFSLKPILPLDYVNADICVPIKQDM